MKTTRTYIQGCTWCNAQGFIKHIGNYTTDATTICPVCNGAKTIIITETTEDNEIAEAYHAQFSQADVTDEKIKEILLQSNSVDERSEEERFADAREKMSHEGERHHYRR
jgi:hypothetical protein